jgi:hypothetical protein
VRQGAEALPGHTDDVLAAENDRRTDAYRKDEAAESALRRINEALAALEPMSWSGRSRPTVFVVGLPRSGTTLVGQLLAATLDLGYVDGLAARFWLAPCQGLLLSSQVLGGRRDVAFASDLGRSLDVAGPHEFAYFWQRWLGIESTADLLAFGEPRRPVDWAALGQTVGCMADTCGRGLFFKTNYAAQFPRHFTETFSCPLLVLVERDPAQVALSILRARRRYYGTSEQWWATLPPHYAELADAPVPVQIAGQIAGLRTAYDEGLGRLEEGVVVRLSYQALCAAPEAAVGEVVDAVARRYGLEIGRLRPAPPAFDERRGQPADDEEVAVVAAVAEVVDRP